VFGIGYDICGSGGKVIGSGDVWDWLVVRWRHSDWIGNMMEVALCKCFGEHVMNVVMDMKGSRVVAIGLCD
jgi:hypothetical protein